MSTDGESSRSPEEESQDSGWMVELIYYNVPGRNDRSRRGKAFRNSTDGELKCFESHDGTKYRPGDHVYIESCSNDPFIIGTISLFKMNKRESLSVKVTRFFRPEEVPEMSISLILQERNELQEAAEPIVDTHPRELFTSESAQSYPISCLRGKCEVSFVKDFRSLDGCDLKKSDAFFSCLAYNQESSRLASVQGEIRVGGAFQAKLPPEATCSVGDEPDRDELIYRPGQIAQQTEEKYIKLARSFRMFAMLDQKMPSVEKNARVSDLLFDDCIGTLHRCGYKYDEALKEMNANDKLLAGDANFMTPEDTKKFSKGIKNFGKNFMRISRELLPLHSREQLVAYYYLWKKTPDATKPKPLSRPRNPVTAVKKAKNGNSKASRPASTEYNDYASASESDVEEGKKGHHYACHHCYSSESKDWHHAGRDSMLLCTDCRLFFKKYGQLRPVDRPSTVPPTLFKRSPSTEHEEDLGVRTRAGKNGRRRTPSMGDERRSPSQAVSIHEFDLEKTGKFKNGKRKKSHVNGSAKKKKTDDTPEKDEKDVKEEARERDPSSSTPPEDPIQNGHHIKEEDDFNSESKDVPMEPSTSKDIPVHKSKEEEDSDTDLYDETEDNTWEAGNDVALETPNAIFVRSVVRKVGHRCSRTDLHYRFKTGGAWDKKKRENEEKAKNPPPPAPVQPAPVVQPIKKPEVNGLALDPRLAAFGSHMDMAQTMHILSQAVQAQQQAQAQAQAHQAMIAQHEQQQMMLKMEVQRQQQAQAMLLQQREAARMGGLPFLDSRSLAAVGMMPPGVGGGIPPGMDPRMLEMIAQNQMASILGQQQQQHQQLQLAAAANPMLSAEMQQLMMNPTMLHAAMQQQQQLANMQAAAMANMTHPGLAVGSDMMRRLQQEGHRAFQP